jgi:uncharacterized protein
MGARVSDRVRLTTIEGGSNFWRTILWAADAFRRAGLEVEIERQGTAGLDNCRRVGRGEADVSVTLACAARMAAAGTGVYRDEPWPVRGLALALHPGHYLYSIFGRDCGIHSFRDLAARQPALRLCVPAENYVSGQIVQALFRAYGVELYRDVEAWGGRLETAYPPVARLMASGAADGMVRESTRLGPALAASAARETIVLSLDREVAEELAAEFGTPTVTLEPRTLRGQNEPVLTIDTTSYPLVVSAAMTDERAYHLARALNAARAQHWITDDVFYTPRHAPETGAPLHPGAARYYREIGVLR